MGLPGYEQKARLVAVDFCASLHRNLIETNAAYLQVEEIYSMTSQRTRLAWHGRLKLKEIGLA